LAFLDRDFSFKLTLPQTAFMTGVHHQAVLASSAFRYP
jgi:hypothetical protein